MPPSKARAKARRNALDVSMHAVGRSGRRALRSSLIQLKVVDRSVSRAQDEEDEDLSESQEKGSSRSSGRFDEDAEEEMEASECKRIALKRRILLQSMENEEEFRRTKRVATAREAYASPGLDRDDESRSTKSPSAAGDSDAPLGVDHEEETGSTEGITTACETDASIVASHAEENGSTKIVATARDAEAPIVANHAEETRGTKRVVSARASDATLGQNECICLRRGGLCSCAEDAAWLLSKRPPKIQRYVPPQRRALQSSPSSAEPSRDFVLRSSAGANEEPEIASGSCICTCSKHKDRCTCATDARWLRRKRQTIVPYVPPHIRSRRQDMDQMREALARKAAASEAEGERSAPSSPNIRTLARQWHSKLENRGECRLNPLQSEGQLVIPDADGLLAECTELSFGGQGVKALPVVKSGSYQFEIELLRDCAVVVGWSATMSLPVCFDSQAYGFSSTGEKVHAQSYEPYGCSYGRAGDVIGAFLSPIVINSSSDRVAQRISFALNGKELGTAFEIGRQCSPLVALPVPLQPHVCQLPQGPLLRVRVRGLSKKLPLLHPVEGFAPLMSLTEQDFCPFSTGVVLASAERQAAGLTEEQLHSFSVPDTHIVELYDFSATSTPASLASDVARVLRIPRVYIATAMHIQPTATGATTAVVAFRRMSHAIAVVNALTGDAAESNGLLARPLQHATADTRARLAELRGENFRPHTDPSVARRLIHGNLHTQIPLPHLVEEKNRLFARGVAAPQSVGPAPDNADVNESARLRIH